MRPYLEKAVTYSDSTTNSEEGVFVPRVIDPSRIINIGSVVGVHPQPVPTYRFVDLSIHSLDFHHS